jgi:HSP20 family protein
MIKIRFGKEIKGLDSKQLKRAIEQVCQLANPMFAISESRTWTPPIDIYENPEDIMVLVEIAGIDKEELHIEIDRSALKIYGRRREMSRMEGSKYHLAEIQYGYFERILYLPAAVDSETVSAGYNDGLLQIRMAKEINRKHSIPVHEL